MAHLLIVDDEPAINDLIAMNLGMVGHSYQQAYCGEDAVRELEAAPFDLALLDIMLPGLDGYQLFERCAQKQVPVIFLTAKDSLIDRVKGLNLGADDYITKPFETLELLARIEAVLRRTGKAEVHFHLGSVEVRFREHLVLRNGEPVELTAQEYALLEVLVRNCNLALTRDQLLEQAWGYDYMGESRTVDMHIQRLRKKLDWEHEIKTVYKYGYRLERG